ncbi:MAG: glycoside hydrolase family 127 protein [Sedimentisphaerales bacterium]|nr:glycoside hydrolase family 127 protein [Sedimentisphaerales bacterium]
MKKLKPLVFQPVDIKEIKPQGWLRQQLTIQANGLTGHLEDFWPDVKDSAWFGGEAEGWERAPYWLDGFMPLAYLLGDKDMIARVEKYLDYILKHQHEDGWLGPKSSNVTNPEAKDRYDIWAQFLATKMVVQYYELSGDKRAVKAVEKALKKIDDAINWCPLFDWGQARWFEALVAILWLYEKKPQQWLLDLVAKLEAQGFGWKTFFASWPMTEATPKGGWNFMSHIVNDAMAVKAYALMHRITADPAEKLATDRMVDMLDKHHGTAVGTFTGDECLAGTKPTRGAELCGAIEYMYSLEHLIQVFGDVKYSDRLEKIAYNSLPAFFTRDMWAHQYDQQTNQIECSINPAMPWNTNDPDANIYGLEPHFGCCTANMHQGWPKFVASLWMKTEDNGIAATAYAPSKLKTTVNGEKVKITLDTDYPFKNKLKFTLESKSKVDFPFYIRIPQWCRSAELKSGKKTQHITAGGAYHKIDVSLNGELQIDLKLNMEVEYEHRHNNAVTLKRGPIVYSLKVEEDRKLVNQDKPFREPPHCDYEIYAKSPWNYALNINSPTTVTEASVDSKCPFSDTNPPVSIKVAAKQLPEWKKDICVAADAPVSPVAAKGQETEIELIPFGCTHLRVTELPYYTD